MYTSSAILLYVIWPMGHDLLLNKIPIIIMDKDFQLCKRPHAKNYFTQCWESSVLSTLFVNMLG